MIPIYVPSYGRWATAHTPRLLEEVGYPYFLVVEEQESSFYQEHFPAATVLLLPKSQQGVAYVRQWILERCYQQGTAWYWMIDDDIKGFFSVEKNLCVPSDARVLRAAESILDKYDDLAQLALTQKRWARNAKKPLTWNNYCNQVVCNHAQRIYPLASYRKDVQEDIDMTLQVVASGYRVARWEYYAFSMPESGTNLGGLHDDYAVQKDFEWSYNMLRLWGPEILHLLYDSRKRVSVSVNWRYFSEKKIQQRLREGL